MNPAYLFSIIRPRLRLVVLMTLMTLAATLLACLILPKTYKASTALVVLNQRGTDAVTGTPVPGQLVPGFTSAYIATQIEIIKSISVAMRVVSQLGLADTPEAKEDFMEDTGGEGDIREWVATALLKKMKVTPSREGNVVEITYRHHRADKAAAIANAFARAYQDTTIQLESDPTRKASVYLEDQVKGLRESLEQARAKLSSYQRDNGIVNIDNRLDVETTRLNELADKHVTAQADLMQALSRRQQIEGPQAADAPEVASNLLIQNLKLELAKAESKARILLERFTPDHPLYLGAKAEADDLRASLQRQTANIARSVGAGASVLQRHEAALSEALEQQREKVLGLNIKRDELSVLAKEADSAQRNYETAMARLAQTRMQGQANQTDVAVLSAATPPMEPSSPKTLLSALLSVVIGALLGMATAAWLELRDRRVRTARHLIDEFAIPVLASMDRVLSDASAGRNLGRLTTQRLQGR